MILALLALAVAAPNSATAQGTGESNLGYAFSWYLRAAEAGDAQAQFMLALQYEQGLRVEGADAAKAEYWYRQAVDSGYPLAQFRLALVLQQRGDAEALAEAARLLTASAEQGLADAQYNLALALETGRGVAADRTMAVAWYRKAAEQGIAAAMYNLGGLLATGPDAPLNDVEAYMWLDLAAAAEIDAATDLRDRLAERMTSALIADARAMANARHVPDATE